MLNLLQNNRELTDKQALFLEYYLENPNDPRGAATKAGYSDNSVKMVNKLIATLHDEILLRSAKRLAMATPKAVNKLIDAMDEDGTIPKGDIRLKAIESVLDRAGLTKKQDVTLTLGVSDNLANSPLFFIPSKASPSADSVSINPPTVNE
jgi:hypothetical protein